MRRLRFALLWLVLLGALVPAAATGSDAARASLANGLRQALRSPDLSLGRTGAVAVDLETGALVFDHNAALPLVPASNEKLPVAWTALVVLGPSYRFHTELYGVGSRTGDVWNGDLVLKGFGDPTLTSSDLAALATRIARSGIRQVTGRVRGDESLYDGKRGAPGGSLRSRGSRAHRSRHSSSTAPTAGPRCRRRCSRRSGSARRSSNEV